MPPRCRALAGLTARQHVAVRARVAQQPSLWPLLDGSTNFAADDALAAEIVAARNNGHNLVLCAISQRADTAAVDMHWSSGWTATPAYFWSAQALPGSFDTRSFVYGAVTAHSADWPSAALDMFLLQDTHAAGVRTVTAWTKGGGGSSSPDTYATTDLAALTDRFTWWARRRSTLTEYYFGGHVAAVFLARAAGLVVTPAVAASCQATMTGGGLLRTRAESVLSQLEADCEGQAPGSVKRSVALYQGAPSRGYGALTWSGNPITYERVT